jgi:hypothetical protein
VVALSLVAGGLSLAACTTPAALPVPPVTTTTQQLSPADALKAALDKLSGASYDFTNVLIDRNSSTSLLGSVKGRTSVQVTASGAEAGIAVHEQVVIINGDAWFKIDLSSLNAQFGIDPTKWMKADLSRLSSHAQPVDLAGPDVMKMHGLFTSVGTVTRPDSTHLTGTVDLTAATSNVSDPQTIAALGPPAKVAPFSVRIDDQGRPVDVSYYVPGTKSEFQWHYSNYGSPSAITPPDAATVIPMPDKVYAALSS